MTSAWLLYLAAATACQALFALFYALGLARLRTFGWNRAYLLAALVLSVALPLVAPPAAWAQWLWPAAPVAALAAPPGPLGLGGTSLATAASASGTAFRWEWVALGAYWLGVAWQAGRTLRGLGWLYSLRRRYPRTRLGQGWLVQLPEPGRPAFSFGRCVFLSPAHARLGAAEHAQLVQHEQVHGQQHHTLDLLLAEVIGWFFWFNGLVGYLRRQLRTVHEYLADEAVAGTGNRAAYSRLLLQLAAGPLPAALVHPFAARQVARRIHMLTSPTSSPMKKLRFLLVAPVAALAWLGAAALQPTPAQATPATTPPGNSQGRIGTISWQGNTYLTAAQLSEALGLRPGDAYSEQIVKEHLGRAGKINDRDIISRYMDNGYLFFQIEPVAKTRPDGSTDLTFVLNEGRQARIGTVTIVGNRKTATADLLAMLPLRSGDLFSRANLIASQRKLFESGLFQQDNPATKEYEGIRINPQPVFHANEATDLVNIELVVLEK